MISEIDEALRTLVRGEALDGAGDVEVVFDAPTKDWAARRNAPTVNCYLYDIREDLRRRERGWVEQIGDDGAVVSRSPAPRYFKLSYLVTAWTQRPEDEHRLLAALIRCFLKHDAMPRELLADALGGSRLDVPITVALPPPEDRAFADVWTALGGELKPSLDVVVVTPIDSGRSFPAGPPVTDGAFLDVADTVNGGLDEMRHRHTPPEASGSAAGEGRLGRGGGLAVGKGRTTRARKRGGT